MHDRILSSISSVDLIDVTDITLIRCDKYKCHETEWEAKRSKLRTLRGREYTDGREKGGCKIRTKYMKQGIERNRKCVG